MYCSRVSFWFLCLMVANAACSGPADDDDSADDTVAGEWEQISAGYSHTCAVSGNGSVACWGLVDSGAAIAPEGTFVQVTTGATHTCALGQDGHVECWGCHGEDAPQCSPPATTFESIDAGTNHTCGLVSDGDVVCWGTDEWGETSPPERSFRQVDASAEYSCGVAMNGDLACWGVNYGHIPDIPLGYEIEQVAAGEEYLCVLTTTCAIQCWQHDYADWDEPTVPPGQYYRLVAGNRYACGLLVDGSANCWGDDEYGQLGVPSDLLDQLHAGADHACGINRDGEWLCWGRDDWGEVSGDTTSALVPIPEDSGATCEDAEPNDCDLETSAEEWGECSQTCAGLMSGSGGADRISGTLESIVDATWDGDNDTFAITVAEEGIVSASLDWDGPHYDSDLDLYLYCYFGDDLNPLGWYVMTTDMAGLSKPEQGQTVVPLPAGTPCYARVVGYQGDDGMRYDLHLWTDSAPAVS